jgi:uncharacterized protein DUF6843
MTHLTLPVAVTVAALGCGGASAQRDEGAVYVVPEGFRGWAKVEYSSPTCPAQKDEDSRNLIVLDAAGTACTRLSTEQAWKNPAFRRRTSRQLLKEALDSACCQPASLPKGEEPGTVFVLGRTGWTCEPRMDVQVFFIGTIDEYNNDRDGWERFACEPSSGRD